AARAAKDFAGSLADLGEALRLDPEYAAAHNNLAWYRATCPDPAFRDGPLAVSHARRACELSGWGSPLSLSTLAAAHGEAGDFGQAVPRGGGAVARARDLEPGRVEEFTAPLRLYENGQRLRED